MILFANFLIAVTQIVHIVLVLYIWVVVFRAVLSWVNVPSLYPVAVVLYRLTEPVLRPIRRFVPPSRLGGIDISPIIVVLLIMFVNSFLVRSISIYAHQLLSKHMLYF